MNPIAIHRLANSLWRHGVPVLPSVLDACLFALCGARVTHCTSIGPGSVLGHGGNGIVIHPDVVIGQRVMICQQVTIGRRGVDTTLPVVGDDVFLGAGAKILGPVRIGDGAVVGANAVVLDSVPSHCVAAGVPARITRENVEIGSVEPW